MFKSKYYNNKFICDYNNTLALFELNKYRNEAYILFKNNEDEIEIRLRDLYVRPLNENEVLIPLKIFLSENGYNENDFSNPFIRTNKIVNELDKINKNKTLKKTI